MESVTAYDLLHKHGGSWLSTCRNFIQRKFHNGSDVTWGSNQELRPTATVQDLEEMASEVAAVVMNKRRVKFLVELRNIEVSRICTALIRTGSDEDLTLATRIRTEHAEYTERKLEDNK